jgi:hypothetical protein
MFAGRVAVMISDIVVQHLRARSYLPQNQALLQITQLKSAINV